MNPRLLNHITPPHKKKIKWTADMFFLNAGMWFSGTQCCKTAAALKGSALIWLVIAILQPSEFSLTF